MSYNIVISKDAERFLSKLNGKIYNSIVAKILELAENPRPSGCTEVKPYANTYRIRQGGYRIIYEVIDNELYIEVLDIGSRGQIYDSY